MRKNIDLASSNRVSGYLISYRTELYRVDAIAWTGFFLYQERCVEMIILLSFFGIDVIQISLIVSYKGLNCNYGTVIFEEIGCKSKR